LFRRIGENESSDCNLPQICGRRKAYRAKPHTAVLADISPVSLVVKRRRITVDDPVLLNGYYFHGIVGSPNVPGGFALIAYPPVSVVRSNDFIVTGKDVVYEKDLAKTRPR